MKKVISNILVLTLLICFTLITTTIFADQPPDPGTGGPGTGDVPVGGSSIGGGLIMLLMFGVAYGSKKLYQSRKEVTE